jgi:hypothetical protein
MVVDHLDWVMHHGAFQPCPAAHHNERSGNVARLTCCCEMRCVKGGEEDNRRDWILMIDGVVVTTSIHQMGKNARPFLWRCDLRLAPRPPTVIPKLKFIQWHKVVRIRHPTITIPIRVCFPENVQ